MQRLQWHCNEFSSFQQYRFSIQIRNDFWVSDHRIISGLEGNQNFWKSFNLSSSVKVVIQVKFMLQNLFCPGLKVVQWALLLDPSVPLDESHLAHRLVCVSKWCSRSLTIFPWIMGLFILPPIPAFWLRGLGSFMLTFNSPTFHFSLKTQMCLLMIFQPFCLFPSVALYFFFAPYRGTLVSVKQVDLVLQFPW